MLLHVALCMYSVYVCDGRAWVTVHGVGENTDSAESQRALAFPDPRLSKEVPAHGKEAFSTNKVSSAMHKKSCSPPT
jgi:hypothetical protein